ncbi:hypothetical protein A2V82_04490 [candidate division KSB1 bacterium RBG_16_48_16]|nr:MAG: hypothetical protein A2V82_04490 [candidate division KSB1 bacterium RBG_16_48_16]
MLLKKYILMAGIMFLSAMMAQSSAATEIAKVTGEVKVRRGLDEKWQNAFAGMMLKNIDTILSLEGEVVLRMDDGTMFHLGSHSILDIGDLRRITRQEMFLYLMAQKVDKIQPRGEKARLHVGNVSVVHGEKVLAPAKAPGDRASTNWLWSLNAARAMYEQNLYPNTIVSLHKLLSRFSQPNDCGEIHLYMGRAFEKLDEAGQALDAYQLAAARCSRCQSVEADRIAAEARTAITRLSE